MVAPALKAMVEELSRVGNPSSLHAAGRSARKIVEEGREAIAQAIGARPSEIIFTGSGTEANNLAVKGLYWASGKKRVLASSIEHHAVLDPVQWLADHEGATVEWLSVTGEGVLDLQALEASILRDPESVALITVMTANNETGSVQPISEIVSLASRFGIPVHSDAVQAFGKIPLDFESSGLAALTVTGHKIGGPLGIGALALRRGVTPTPLLHGGGQERDVRSGTLDAPAIAGFAAAARYAVEQQENFARHYKELRTLLVDGVLSSVPDARINGSKDGVPSIAHFTFPGAEGDALLLLLDAQGVECSTGSACSAGVPGPSHVLIAMGMSDKEARASLRFSLGHTSTREDVERLLAVLPDAVARGRAAGQQ